MVYKKAKNILSSLFLLKWCEVFLKKLKNTIEDIKTPGQLNEFIHLKIKKRFKTGANISVQPPSLARRKAGVTRGAKRLPSGRHAKLINNSLKKRRQHNISQNISNNSKN